MKKLIALILALVMCLSLCACGGGTDTEKSELNSNKEPDAEEPAQEESTQEEPAQEESAAIPIELGDAIDHSAFYMTFDSMQILPEYSYNTGEYSSFSLHVEDGYKILLVQGHIENKYTSAISDSCFVRTVLVNGTYEVTGYDVRLNFERSKHFEVDPYTDVNYNLYINIPDKLADIFETATFSIAFNDDMSIPTTVYNIDGTITTETDNVYALTAKLETEGSNEGNSSPDVQPEVHASSIAIGDTIVTPDYELTLKTVEFTYELLPKNTSSVYSSYPAESGKVYIHIAADVKNTMQRNIRIEELYIAKALYDGKYSYEGFTVVDDDNRFDWVGSYVAATPLETCGVHVLIECPVEVDTSGNPVTVIMEIGGTNYDYILR